MENVDQQMINIKDPEYIQKVLQEAYERGLEAIPDGECASYIPELAKVNKNDFGIVIANSQGRRFEVGDTTKRFSVQSIVKVITLALSLRTYGYHKTFTNVMMEPSGDSFNSILKLDSVSNKPYNPMINAGAIEVVSMLVDEYSFNDLLNWTKKMCMDEEITLNESVYQSESKTGDRNRAIAYLLNSKGVLSGDPEKTLDLYFKACSLNVTANSLANLGIILSNDGKNPFTGEVILDPFYVRIINSIMFTCGMYDNSGFFGVKVGIPAKSGVGGGITCGVKHRMGIGVYGPALNAQGNSVAGVKALRYLSDMLHLHVFDYV